MRCGNPQCLTLMDEDINFIGTWTQCHRHWCAPFFSFLYLGRNWVKVKGHTVFTTSRYRPLDLSGINKGQNSEWITIKMCSEYLAPSAFLPPVGSASVSCHETWRQEGDCGIHWYPGKHNSWHVCLENSKTASWATQASSHFHKQ